MLGKFFSMLQERGVTDIQSINDCMAILRNGSRIIRNLPYASRGYVFKDASLRAYFISQWWYMPDASWNGSTDDFLPNEWKLINDYK